MKTLSQIVFFVFAFSFFTNTEAQAQVPDVDICLVTVDSTSSHNIVVWEKPISSEIDSFLIYRIFTDSIYYKVGSVHYDSLSTFHDLDPLADPNTDPHRYKMSVLDTAGNESALSDYHQTMHLTVSTAGEMFWSWYKIENVSNPVDSFNCYRDDDGTGDFQIVNVAAGSIQAWIDNDFSLHPDARYVVDVDWPISCAPTRENVNTTRSNLDERVAPSPQGIEEELAKRIEIYPNPSNGPFNIRIPAELKPKEIIIWSSLGAIAGRRSISRGNYQNQFSMDIPSLTPGIYLVEILTTKGSVAKKLMVR